MKGIETRAHGHLFRSRLEAKWATLFTELGWQWEYEPFDANGYIPDFVLLGKRPVLVEVKPATTADEYREHVGRLEQSLHGHWRHDVLIVGISPYAPFATCWSQPSIGLLGEWIPDYDWDTGLEKDDRGGWDFAAGVWARCPCCPLITFAHDYQSYAHRICGHYTGNVGDAPRDLTHLWRSCGDKTRWTKS